MCSLLALNRGQKPMAHRPDVFASGRLGPGMQAAIDLLEAEAQRQLALADNRFGDGDTPGSMAARDIALAYRTAKQLLEGKVECLLRKK